MNSLRIVAVGLVACVSITAAVRGQDAAGDDNPVALSQEIKAFHTLTELEATAEQMKVLKEAARGAADPHPPAVPANFPAKHLDALKALRDALAKPIADAASEDDKQAHDEAINAAESALGEAGIDANGNDVPNNEFNDAVEITPAARTSAPAVVSRLTPTQILSHLGNSEDRSLDPVQALNDALDDIRSEELADVEPTIKDVADYVAMLVVGLDPEKSGDLHRKIADILVGVKQLSDEDFEKQEPELKKSLAALVAGADPFTVLRHAMEHDIAELLSNPRLNAALDARLK